MRVNFEEVSIHAEKNMKCAGGCGRRLKRRQKFFQTINPFNRLSDGTVKSRYEIMPELREEARKWKEEPVTCIHCSS